ncbi:MAG: DnaJ domain-containing protein [Xanthomonadaceae bacterium]|nr:DnaJ domain-containing protein [Xanthomonadaceae bacterium]
MSGYRGMASSMNRWYGKLLGLIAGALLFRANPMFGAVIGLVIGHFIDRRWPQRYDDDPYRALEVSRTASDTEIEQAYRRLISRYHPDRLGEAAADLRERAERKSREINAAYDRIKALRRRKSRG